MCISVLLSGAFEIFPEKYNLVIDAVLPIVAVMPARAFDVIVVDFFIQ